MSNPEPNRPAAAEELTPEARVMLGRARRSFGISIGILLLGFMAIGFALVYRVMRDRPAPSVAESISLPFHFEAVSAILIDNTIQVTTRDGNSAMLNIFNAETGELISSVNINSDLRPEATLESLAQERESGAEMAE
ncbi:DUF6476 family protein [Devosia rhizoryzae]|uniref:Photosynthetic complex assembly protein n=1 Tax=Devosia rhizoryzae TaxID=2774137 RepID=A0ABX7C5T3_9HYPH|nr:DUF6476 family protein [Devosia rhizoryzae]QQR39620.1 hypothetical protein JI748_00960 [Devosia rhizoryzae]